MEHAGKEAGRLKTKRRARQNGGLYSVLFRMVALQNGLTYTYILTYTYLEDAILKYNFVIPLKETDTFQCSDELLKK